MRGALDIFYFKKKDQNVCFETRNTQVKAPNWFFSTPDGFNHIKLVGLQNSIFMKIFLPYYKDHDIKCTYFEEKFINKKNLKLIPSKKEPEIEYIKYNPCEVKCKIWNKQSQPDQSIIDLDE